MKLSRRQFQRLAAGAAVLPFPLEMARAQAWPSRPVRFLVGYTPGGGNDIVARLMGQWFSERLGQPFLIENRPGAATNMAAEAVVHAAPDGYTLLLVGQPNAINATLYETLPFNFIRDIARCRQHRDRAERDGGPSIVSGEDRLPMPIAYAKANPGKINMASAERQRGPSAGELFSLMTGISMVHVPIADRRRRWPTCWPDRSGPVRHLARFDGVSGPQSCALAVTTEARSEARPTCQPWAASSRLRGERVVPRRRASGDVNRDRRQVEQGSECGARRRQAENAAGRPGWHPDRGLPRRFRQAHRRGNREVGQGHPHGQYQALSPPTFSRSPTCQW